MTPQLASENPDPPSTKQEIKATLDPDADEQRWYTCQSCGWPCINPIGTVPEQRDECLDCASSSIDRQASLQEFNAE